MMRWISIFMVAGWLSTGTPPSLVAAPPVLMLQRAVPNGQQQLVPRSQNVIAEGYPYGYFGAQTSSHWSRHYGYYNQYHQWTRR